jgi:serine protease
MLKVENIFRPFNPETTIRYSVPSIKNNFAPSLLVSLKVYDLLGREVATLVDETKTSGIYDAHFNASGLASGMYLYRIIVGGTSGTAKIFTATKKLLLVK